MGVGAGKQVAIAGTALLKSGMSALGWGPIIGMIDAVENEAELDALKHRVAVLEQALGNDPEQLQASLHDILRLVKPPASRLRHAESCLEIAKQLNESSRQARENDPIIGHEPAMELLGALGAVKDPESEFVLVADELWDAGLVHRHMNASRGPGAIGSLGPTPEFFWRTDALFQSWNPEHDAVRFARMGLQSGQRPFQVQEADTELQFGIRRMNSALAYLASYGCRRTDDLQSNTYFPSAVHLTSEATHLVERMDDVV